MVHQRGSGDRRNQLHLHLVSEVVHQRIEKELTVIRDKGYADYFLVVDEIVRQAPRTCGRGSAAASTSPAA